MSADVLQERELPHTSLLAKNIQLLCARHNLQKHDKII